ncbi:MAG: glutathione S-transferase family protein [Polyangiales bacterium]
MQLYTFPPSPNCRKVHTLIDHLGLDVDIKQVNILAGEQKRPEFRALNPNSKVPVLVDGETTLWESNAILAYLAGKQDTALWPRSAARYSILRWLNWEAAHFSRAAGTLLFERLLKTLTQAGPEDTEVTAKAEDNFRACASVLNHRLAERPFLEGEACSIADFSIGVFLDYREACRLPLADCPHVQAWHHRLRALPAWQRNLPQLPA